ncbi:hypothetical protein GOODEAATRI_004427, partial [Goodea atripinnis]
ELVKDKPDVKCWSPIFGYPQAVSHIYVKGAEIHQHSDQVDDLYKGLEGRNVPGPGKLPNRPHIHLPHAVTPGGGGQPCSGWTDCVGLHTESCDQRLTTHMKERPI